MATFIAEALTNDVLVAPRIKPFVVRGVKQGGLYEVTTSAPLLKVGTKYVVLGVEKVQPTLTRSYEGIKFAKRKLKTYNTLTATLCSKTKKKIPKGTPIELWDSSAIKRYVRYCRDVGLPVAILSYKYGVVPEDVEVWTYDEFDPKDKEHWETVLSEARDLLRIQNLYLWVPSRKGIPTVILDAMREVFSDTGATNHLSNLPRILQRIKNTEKSETVPKDTIELITSVVPRGASIKIIGEVDLGLARTLRKVKRCRLVVTNTHPWLQKVLRAVTKKKTLTEDLKLREKTIELGWLDDLFKQDGVSCTLAILSLLPEVTIEGMKQLRKETVKRKMAYWKATIAKWRTTAITYAPLGRTLNLTSTEDIVIVKDKGTSWLSRDQVDVALYRDLIKRAPALVIAWQEKENCNKLAIKVRKYITDVAILATKNSDIVLAR